MKKELLIQLKLKLMDLKLEKDKSVINFGISAIIGIFALLINLGIITNFSELVKNTMANAISSNNLIEIVFMIIIYLVVFPLLAFFVSQWLLNQIFLTYQKAYNKRIREIEELINESKK
jgi:hypothetical protein